MQKPHARQAEWDKDVSRLSECVFFFAERPTIYTNPGLFYQKHGSPKTGREQKPRPQWVVGVPAFSDAAEPQSREEVSNAPAVLGD